MLAPRFKASRGWVRRAPGAHQRPRSRSAPARQARAAQHADMLRQRQESCVRARASALIADTCCASARSDASGTH
eukprot:11191212-Alexandrium_andersonii.AAC.1